jgi:hypothetical protein
LHQIDERDLTAHKLLLVSSQLADALLATQTVEAANTQVQILEIQLTHSIQLSQSQSQASQRADRAIELQNSLIKEHAQAEMRIVQVTPVAFHK